MSDALGLAAANLCFLVAGVGVTAAAGWWRGVRGLAASVGVAYLAGVAAYGVSAQLLLVLGAPLTRWQVVLVCGVLALGVLFGRGAPGPPFPRVPPVLAIGVGAVLALLLVDLLYQPLWAYDAWTFWTPKARALAALGGLDAAWFTSADLANRDYPLLLPAVEAAGFRFTGYETRLLDVQSWLFVAALLAAIWQIVAPRASVWLTAAVVATIALAPSLADQLASAEADIPLAAFFVCAGLCAYLWLTEDWAAALVLFGLFGAATAATKVEGVAFVLALTAVAALVARGRSRALLAAAGLAGLAAGVVPWRLWVAAHDVPYQASQGRVADLGEVTGRVPHATAYVLARFVDPRAWLLLVPLCAFVAVSAWRAGARRPVVFAVGTVALCLLALLVAYWTTPFDLDYHLASSARRVITGPLLLWAALTPLVAAAGDRGRYPDRP